MFTQIFQREIQNFSDQIAEKGYWICEDVFTEKTLETLLLAYEDRRILLKPASVGKNGNKIKYIQIRNDYINWLNGDEESFKPIWCLLDLVKNKLRSELYLTVKRYEAHVSLYPAGRFYKKHKDQHKLTSSRLISSVFYFNNWAIEDSGELVIYKKNGEEVKISPDLNKVIFFKSELEHEVLKSLKERKSLTSWFRDDLA